MSSFRFSTPGSYGLMGRTLNPLRETLDRTFAEDDRPRAELERWEWERRSKEKAPVVKPMVETVSASDLRVIKRSHSDGIERVWIAGGPRSKYLIAGIANTASVNSHNCVQLPRGAELNLPIPVLWRHAKYGG